jgi:protein-export membrane protein SecD
MKDRTPLVLGLILVLAVVVVFLNMDLFVPDYEYPDSVTKLLRWQSEEPSQRSLEIREGLDLQGGLQVLLQADMTDQESAKLEQAASSIQNRVDALGVTEPLVQTQGEDKIVVELPGVEDPELAVRTIGETALLEFIYSADKPLQPESKVLTSWEYTHTLWTDLPEEQKQPFLAPVPAGLLEEGDGEEAVATEPSADEEQAAGDEEEAAATEPADEEQAAGDEEEAAATEPADEEQAAGDEEEAAATEPADEEQAAGDEEEAAATEPADEEQAAGDEEEAAATEPAADQEQAAGEGAEEGLETVYPTVLTGDHFDSASRGLDTVTNEIVVNFALNKEGGKLLREFTSSHIGEFMPITLDGKVISSPTINASIGSQGQITGNFTSEEADILVAQLESGALPVDLTVVGQTRIGPTLGGEAVAAAIKGGIIGLAVVVLFMLIYYRLPGIVADIALMLYVLIVLALFRLLPVTLTLAGIAGFILSIGMAVDANILIFERMKEELRAGRRISSAMEIGFSRAWPSIRDSNMSTLITCAILFWFGNQFGASIVKGFAITLAVGVITSLFTAITVTRNLLKIATKLALREKSSSTLRDDPQLGKLFGI